MIKIIKMKFDKNDRNKIKKQVIYLYVCYRPGLEGYSSRPGIVSRSSEVLSVEGVLSVEREERMSERKLRNKAMSRTFVFFFVKHA